MMRWLVTAALLLAGFALAQDKPVVPPKLSTEDALAIRDLERRIYREDRVQAESKKRQAEFQEKLAALLRGIFERTGCQVRETEPPEEKLVCAALEKGK